MDSTEKHHALKLIYDHLKNTNPIYEGWQFGKPEGLNYYMEISIDNKTYRFRGTNIDPDDNRLPKEPVVQIREWSIDRIHHLAEHGSLEQQFDAVAIAEEFDEWINIPEGVKELDYLCLEDQDIGDKEMDIN